MIKDKVLNKFYEYYDAQDYPAAEKLIQAG